MHVISFKKLRDFYQAHPGAREPLLAWYRLACEGAYSSPAALGKTFPQADYVRPFHVFNIGRRFRLVAAIHFNRQKVYVRHVLTHADYDLGKWKKDAP